MTLNDRERFVLHAMSIMVVDSMIKRVQNGEQFTDIIPMTAGGMISVMNDIGKNRCRKLSRLEISEMYEDISEEMLLGTEMHKDSLYDRENL